MLEAYYKAGITKYRLNIAKSEAFDNVWIAAADIIKKFYREKTNVNVNFVIDIPLPGYKARVQETNRMEVFEEDKIIIVSDKRNLNAANCENYILIDTNEVLNSIHKGEIITIGESKPRFIIEEKNTNYCVVRCVASGLIPSRKYLTTENVKYFPNHNKKLLEYYKYIIDYVKPEAIANFRVPDPTVNIIL